MSKWIEVVVKSTNSYLVELEDDQPEEDAADIIIDSISYDWDEIDQSEFDGDNLEGYKHHFNKSNIYPL